MHVGSLGCASMGLASKASLNAAFARATVAVVAVAVIAGLCKAFDGLTKAITADRGKALAFAFLAGRANEPLLEGTLTRTTIPAGRVAVVANLEERIDVGLLQQAVTTNNLGTGGAGVLSSTGINALPARFDDAIGSTAITGLRVAVVAGLCHRPIVCILFLVVAAHHLVAQRS